MISTKNIQIDIMRAIGIILMVLGHSHCPGTYYIYLFHMALFFMISGYCYNTERTDSGKALGVYIFQKFKRLYIPFVLFNAFLLIVDHFVFNRGLSLKDFIILFIQSLNMNSGSTLSGAFWFLKTMLMLVITYALFDFLLKRIPHIKKHPLIVHSVLSAIMLILGFICYLKGIRLYDYDKVLSFYVLFHIGRLFREKIHFNMNHIKRVLVMALSLVVLFICRRFGEIELGANEYVNPAFLLATSISGWLLVYELSYYLSLIKGLNTILKIIGNNTISVMVFHFLCFKGVTYIQILIYDLPKSAISAFPVLYNMPFWWLVYTIVGLCIPVGISLLYKRLIPHHK